MAISRHDIQSPVDRDIVVAGQGSMRGWPTSPATSNSTTGVPTNGVAGFAKGALFHNFKGSVGSLLYINTGTVTSATWLNIA